MIKNNIRISRLEKKLERCNIKANDFRIKFKTAERRRLVLLEQNKEMRKELQENAVLIKNLMKPWYKKLF